MEKADELIDTAKSNQDRVFLSKRLDEHLIAKEWKYHNLCMINDLCICHSIEKQEN